MLALIGLTYAGLAWLCLAMDRHHRQVAGGTVQPGIARLLRLAGFAALVLSFAAAIAAEGWSLGPVAWFGSLTAAGLALVLLLPYRPRLAIGLSLAGCLVAILDLLAGTVHR